MLKLLLVELIGTFILALLVGTLLINAGVGSYVAFYIPCGAAVTIGLFTYCFSESELGSLNPAVALGKYLANKLSILGLGVAVGSELVGAYCGILLARFLNDAPLLVPQGYSIRADIGELIGSALFVFVVIRSAYGQIAPQAGGLAVGVALLIGLSISLSVSGGILNPALALGMGAIHLSYLLMPLIGGGIGALLARAVRPVLINNQ